MFLQGTGNSKKGAEKKKKLSPFVSHFYCTNGDVSIVLPSSSFFFSQIFFVFPCSNWFVVVLFFFSEKKERGARSQLNEVQ